MPIYEYRCNSCGKTFEELVMPGDGEARVKCPLCGSESCDKLMSTPAFKVDGRMVSTTCCGAETPCGKSCRSCK